MSKYKPLYSSIWTDGRFENYSPEKKLVYIFLLTNQYVEKSGIYKLSIRQIAFNTSVSNDLINEIINDLINEGKIQYDFEESIIFVKNLFKYQKGMIKNDNILLLTLKRNYELVKTEFWEEFFERYSKDSLASKINDLLIDGSLMAHQLYINNNKNKNKNPNKGGVGEKPKKPKPEKTELELVLPEFLNKELWGSFVEMRKQKKKPLTDKAAKLTLADLQKFEDKQKGFANIALENSIKNSWQGVFEPRNDKQQPQKQSKHNNFEQQDYYADTEGFEVC